EILTVVPLGLTKEEDWMMCASDDGHAMAVNAEEISLLSGPGRGVIVMKLARNANLIGAELGHRDLDTIAVSRAGGTERSLQGPACDGPLSVRDDTVLQKDLANFSAAVKAHQPMEGFLTASSPGVVTVFLQNQYYPDHDAYLEALAEILKAEYEAIVASGAVLQLDCPDLAMGRHVVYRKKSVAEFRKIAARHIEVLNAATTDIPPESMRLHLCWGNYSGPHHHDIELSDILDLVYTARPHAISIEGANPRHGHEWTVFDRYPLPDGKIIIPGVIDSTSNFIEHPELVAQRICAYASKVGRERVIAGADCGFATFAERPAVDPDIAWAKLGALVEGAALASDRLW
uniref:hypothetical protein n=1 Tax=uncultured Alcanivorax sp. TaxID=191215 RepID=UPI00261E4DA7